MVKLVYQLLTIKTSRKFLRKLQAQIQAHFMGISRHQDIINEPIESLAAALDDETLEVTVLHDSTKLSVIYLKKISGFQTITAQILFKGTKVNIAKAEIYLKSNGAQITQARIITSALATFRAFPPLFSGAWDPLIKLRSTIEKNLGVTVNSPLFSTPFTVSGEQEMVVAAQNMIKTSSVKVRSVAYQFI